MGGPLKCKLKKEGGGQTICSFVNAWIIHPLIDKCVPNVQHAKLVYEVNIAFLCMYHTIVDANFIELYYRSMQKTIVS